VPLYEYGCPTCESTTDVRHGFDETPELRCEKCGAALKRLFSAAPIVFKGSGFYINDSRSSSSATKSEKSETKSDAKSESKSDSSSEAKSESKSETKAEAKSESKSETKSESKSEAKSETKSEKKKDGKYTLQLSSFKDKDEAQAFLDQIRSEGYTASMTKADVDGKQFYRVRMGSYANADAAADAKAEFEKSAKKSALVTKL
jgi:putative FmdB family regulatory protein